MKLREYFLCTMKTKITTLFNNFFSCVSVLDMRLPIPRRMRVVLLTQGPAIVMMSLYICVPNEGLTGLKRHEGE